MKHTEGPWFATEGVDNYPDWNVRDVQGWWVVSVRNEPDARLIAKAPEMYDQLASARAIMEKFVFKVDTGRARSTETYAEMKEWLDD